MSLTSRQKKILGSLVREFILSAEPVSSGVLESKLENLCSSATIRNEMVELEKTGYLQRPHVSAGRVPTNQAYRYYVDFLMDKEKLSLEEQYTIKEELNEKIYQVDQLLDKTLSLIAKLTRHVSILVPPNLNKVKIKDIRLISINPYSILIVIVTTTGLIINRVIENPTSISEEEIERINRILKEKVKGYSLNHIDYSVIDSFDNQSVKHLFRNLIDEINRAILPEVKRDIRWEGTKNLLEKPEFRNVDKIKNLLDILEDCKFVEFINKNDNKTEVTVLIGQENKIKEMSDCTLITAYYGVSGEVIGKLGILGPTRMHYSRMVPLVSFVAHSFSNMLKRMDIET